MSSERGIRYELRNARVYVARQKGKVVAALTLTTKKPWAIDRKYFQASTRPLYLLGLTVAPDRQRTGLGRRCVEEAVKIARAWPGDALRLDAFDAPAGAGEFYRKCGFKEVGRATYRAVPLIYFEMVW